MFQIKVSGNRVHPSESYKKSILFCYGMHNSLNTSILGNYFKLRLLFVYFVSTPIKLAICWSGLKSLVPFASLLHFFPEMVKEEKNYISQNLYCVCPFHFFKYFLNKFTASNSMNKMLEFNLTIHLTRNLFYIFFSEQKKRRKCSVNMFVIILIEKNL